MRGEIEGSMDTHIRPFFIEERRDSYALILSLAPYASIFFSPKKTIGGRQGEYFKKKFFFKNKKNIIDS